MTFSYKGGGLYHCLSTDTKTTTGIATNALCVDDKNNIWRFNGVYWFLVGGYPNRTNRVTGTIQAGMGAVAATGLLATTTAVAGAPAVSNAFTAADGTRGLNYATNATDLNNAGLHVTVTHHIRQWNPYFQVKFKLSSLTLARLYIGTNTNTTDPTGDDPLNANAGFMLGLKSGDTTWRIFHNDASGATIDLDTAITADTSIHTFEMIGDNANTRYGWSLDGSTISWINTDIPAATTNQSWVIETQTHEAVAKTLTLYHAYFEMDG